MLLLAACPRGSMLRTRSSTPSARPPPCATTYTRVCPLTRFGPSHRLGPPALPPSHHHAPYPPLRLRHGTRVRPVLRLPPPKRHHLPRHWRRHRPPRSPFPLLRLIPLYLESGSANAERTSSYSKPPVEITGPHHGPAPYPSRSPRSSAPPHSRLCLLPHRIGARPVSPRFPAALLRLALPPRFTPRSAACRVSSPRSARAPSQDAPTSTLAPTASQIMRRSNARHPGPCLSPACSPVRIRPPYLSHRHHPALAQSRPPSRPRGPGP